MTNRAERVLDTIAKFDDVSDKISRTVEEITQQTQEFIKQVDDTSFLLADHNRVQDTRGEYRDRKKQ